METVISSIAPALTMLDLFLAGPVVSTLAIADVGIHLYLDIKKAKSKLGAIFMEPSTDVPSSPMAATVISTLLSFALVLVIMIAWALGIETANVLTILIPLAGVPDQLWIGGLLLFACGVFLHVWSRYERQDMATSWEMQDNHKLITTGPYSRIRHPSYSSYFICFFALFMMLPSIVSLIQFIGIWGYREIAFREEESLLHHFGGAYKEYMNRTGRFLPKIG